MRTRHASLLHWLKISFGLCYHTVIMHYFIESRVEKSSDLALDILKCVFFHYSTNDLIDLCNRFISLVFFLLKGQILFHGKKKCRLKVPSHFSKFFLLRKFTHHSELVTRAIYLKFFMAVYRKNSISAWMTRSHHETLKSKPKVHQKLHSTQNILVFEKIRINMFKNVLQYVIFLLSKAFLIEKNPLKILFS